MNLSRVLEQSRVRSPSFSGLTIYAIAVYIFLFLPISMILLFSFNASTSGMFPLTGLTLDWYKQVLGDQQIVAAAQRSLIVATLTALISGVLGTLCSLGLSRFNFRFKGTLWVIILLPMVMPALMLGVSLLTYFHTLGLRLSLATVTISHCVWALPYVIFIVYARLKEFDRSVEEAAHDLGANNWQTFARVTFPLIATSVISAMMIIFAWSFDDFLVTFFTIGGQPTLPIIIWGMLRSVLTPTVNALGSLLFLVSIILLVLARWIGKLDIEF
jgi:spermidine/putrescine transport system permease protein